jgi:hypothetical protein
MQLKSRHFSSEPQVISAAATWLDGQNYNFFVCLHKLQQLAKKCVELPQGWVE